MARQPASIETSELRKRLRHTIDERRKVTAARRQRIDAAAAAYTELLALTATPLVQMLANALRADGHNFTVFTPNDGLRMALTKSADDFIEFTLDTSLVAAPPARQMADSARSTDAPPSGTGR